MVRASKRRDQRFEPSRRRHLIPHNARRALPLESLDDNPRDALLVPIRIISDPAASTARVRTVRVCGFGMKFDQGPGGEIHVLDSGYTDQVLLDRVSEEFLRIRAVVYNSLNDLNKLFLVDRALYTNTPDLPIYFEFTPQNLATMKTPLVLTQVKLYFVETMWGISTLRLMK